MRPEQISPGVDALLWHIKVGQTYVRCDRIDPAKMKGDVMTEPEKFHVDPSGDPNPGVADHALPDDAKGPHPLADPANDPTPGVPGHAKDD
jgi:hypothetical protein